MRDRADGESGLTLIEVLATVVILTLITLPLLSLFDQLLIQSRVNAQRETAVMLARQTIAQAVAQGSQSVANQLTTTNSGGTVFTIKTTLLHNQAWTSGLPYLEVTVSWTTMSTAIPMSRPVVKSVTLSQVLQK